MKSKRAGALLICGTFILAMMACNFPLGSSSGTSTEDAGEIEKLVEQTLEAEKSQAAAQEKPTPLPEPSPTPVPNELVVFYTDANHDLWKWSEKSGTSEKIVGGGDVSDSMVSDDGRMVALARTKDYINYSLWVMKIDGSDLHQVVSAEDFMQMKNSSDAKSAMPFVYDWVPNQHQLAFVTSPIFEGPGMIINDDLWIVDAEQGGPRALLTPGNGGIFSYSPDGSKIAISTANSISVVDADGQNRRELLRFDTIINYSEFYFYPEPRWAPDGSYLRVGIPPKDPYAQPAQSTAVWYLPLDGSQAIQTAQVPALMLSNVNFSDDLTRFAYIQQIGGQDSREHELHIANVDGSGDISYASGDNLVFMGWSPDAQNFVLKFGGDVMKSYLGKAGFGYIPFSSVGNEVGINWIDPEKVIFLQRMDAGWKIFIAKPGGLAVEIADLPENSASFFPTYSFSN